MDNPKIDNVSWPIILIGSLLWLIMAFTAIIYGISYTSRNTLLNNELIDTNCNREYVKQAWIYDITQNASCPILNNDLIVINNFLFQRGLEKNGNCCFFNDTLTEILYPTTYIGDPNIIYTDAQLNQKPYLVNSQKTTITMYCPVCTSNTVILQKISDTQYFLQSNAYMQVKFQSNKIVQVTNNGIIEASLIDNKLVASGSANTDTIKIVNINNRLIGFQPLPV